MTSTRNDRRRPRGDRDPRCHAPATGSSAPSARRHPRRQLPRAGSHVSIAAPASPVPTAAGSTPVDTSPSNSAARSARRWSKVVIGTTTDPRGRARAPVVGDAARPPLCGSRCVWGQRGSLAEDTGRELHVHYPMLSMTHNRRHSVGSPALTTTRTCRRSWRSTRQQLARARDLRLLRCDLRRAPRPDPDRDARRLGRAPSARTTHWAASRWSTRGHHPTADTRREGVSDDVIYDTAEEADSYDTTEGQTVHGLRWRLGRGRGR